MFEIFNRLKKNPALLTKIIIASFFVNILALATPIYVIQVLQNVRSAVGNAPTWIDMESSLRGVHDGRDVFDLQACQNCAVAVSGVAQGSDPLVSFEVVSASETKLDS